MPAGSRLKDPLDRLYREFDWSSRTAADAIRFPLRYRDPADLEIAALLASCMAYGRVDLFGPWVDWTLERMGDSPAAFVRGFDLEKERPRFTGFRYRFNRERDVLALCLASQRVLARWGSLKGLFLGGPACRPRARELRLRLPRAGPLRRLPAQPPLLRLPPLVPAAVDGRRVQADASASSLDGQAGAARLRPLDRGAAGGAPHAGGHAHREHGPVRGPDAPAQPQLEDGRGDHGRAQAPRRRGSRQVRLRPVPQAHVGAVPEPAGGRRVRALRPQARLRALER